MNDHIKQRIENLVRELVKDLSFGKKKVLVCSSAIGNKLTREYANLTISPETEEVEIYTMLEPLEPTFGKDKDGNIVANFTIKWNLFPDNISYKSQWDKLELVSNIAWKDGRVATYSVKVPNENPGKQIKFNCMYSDHILTIQSIQITESQ